MNQSIALPYFVHPRNKATVGFGSAIFAAILYMMSNHFPLFEPQLLPMTAVDHLIPFWPSMVWVYLSEYFLILSAFFMDDDLKMANRFVCAFIALQLISSALFFAYPTSFPRLLFPMPMDADPGSAFILNFIRQADTPGNCAPSLHVSSCYLASFVFLEIKGKKRWLFLPYFFWATAVAFATMATKQHYLIDVILGLLLGYAVYWYFIHKVEYYTLIPRNLSPVRFKEKVFRCNSL